MNTLLHTAGFWYALCILIIFAVTIGGIRHHLKTILKKNAEKELTYDQNRTEN